MGVIGYQKTQRGNSWCHVQCTRFHQHVWMTCFEDNAVGGSGVSEVHSIWTGTKHHVLITSGTHVNKAIKPMHSTLHMSTPDDCCIRIEWWSTTNCLEINECRQWQCWHESHLLTKKKPLASCSIGLTVVLASIYDIIAINKWILENKPSNYNTFFSREHMVSRIQVSRTCFLTHHPQPHHRVKLSSFTQSQLSDKCNANHQCTRSTSLFQSPHHGSPHHQRWKPHELGSPRHTSPQPERLTTSCLN